MYSVSWRTGRIGEIEVEYPMIVETGRETTLSIHLDDTENKTYTESVTLTITSSGEPTKVMYFDSAPQKISATFVFDIVDNHTVLIVADNKVSQMSKNVTVNVICK